MSELVDPQEIRRKIAALFGGRAIELAGKENPRSGVDYTEPEVVALADTTAADLVEDWNEGDGTVAALLFEIADEEGWS
ncbi:hypothetical protein SAMN05421810_10199 [Amycolatopsis arida]|uniref:Uncharacterized protein n=1 Tax=Amycolatopsis arida TaxID=587909 RepID=A0A1I5KDC4_9PSEU|nr:hypothetical protein [Amycolatopsis arida]TDX96995.1 hypothetical protein CLV69_10297 [Amycolatopsis arida]SFO82978.1 hypothetical protein SAMN05421810_10199 [Amycolatopsis arida]